MFLVQRHVKRLHTFTSYKVSSLVLSKAKRLMRLFAGDPMEDFGDWLTLPSSEEEREVGVGGSRSRFGDANAAN